MGRLIPAGAGMEFYGKVKIPDELIEGLDGRSKGRPRPERRWRTGHSALPTTGTGASGRRLARFVRP